MLATWNSTNRLGETTVVQACTEAASRNEQAVLDATRHIIGNYNYSLCIFAGKKCTFVELAEFETQ
jgi:hypothetical protein